MSSAGTLQTSIPASTYAAGSFSASAFNALNVARQGAGAGLIAQSVGLDIAAGAHAAYTTTNLNDIITDETPHSEFTTKPGYYESTVNSRIAKSGYGQNNSTEVIGGGSTGGNVILGLLNSVYHGVALLGPYNSAGIGIGLDGANNPLIVGDLASLVTTPYSQVPAFGSILAYPYQNQINVFANFYASAEAPRIPATLFPSSMAGSPIIIGVRNSDYVNYKTAGTLAPTVNIFTLKDSAGNLVPSKILSSSGIQSAAGVVLNTDPQLPAAFIVLVPISPLSQSQTYTASFSATLKTGGVPVAKTWSFTTDAKN